MALRAKKKRHPKVLNKFQRIFERLFGDRIREDEKFAKECWGSLANVRWYSDIFCGYVYGCSFRYAGGIIYSIKHKYDGRDYNGMGYMDYYFSAPDGIVHPDVEKALKAEGFYPISLSKQNQLGVIEVWNG